jgi:hypothetical protein
MYVYEGMSAIEDGCEKTVYRISPSGKPVTALQLVMIYNISDAGLLHPPVRC